MSAPDVDVLIVGGGLVGGSLALALEGSGLKVALLEAQTDQERLTAASGDRALALSRGTVQSLKDLGLWDSVAEQAMAIHHIHVSDRGHFRKNPALGPRPRGRGTGSRDSGTASGNRVGRAP